MASLTLFPLSASKQLKSVLLHLISPANMCSITCAMTAAWQLGFAGSSEHAAAVLAALAASEKSCNKKHRIPCFIRFGSVIYSFSFLLWFLDVFA